jgi:hypothetical protein
MRFIASAAFVLLGTAGWTAPALAVQDTPATINGVETVCTGVGSAKDDPRWSGYPVKIVIANTAGENVAAMNIALTQNGKPVVQTICDAPWILFKLPAGHYSARATMASPPGTSRTTDFSIAGSGGQKELTITFPAAVPNQ